MTSHGKNIVLIGMPGAGKSTAGVLLAKALRMPFEDTDILIQTREGKTLQEIIRTGGMDAFLDIERRMILSLRLRNHVIATGGSVVYSERAVKHLKQSGVLVYFDVSIDEIERRLSDIKSRGVVIGPGMNLEKLYEERTPLYERYADITIDCEKMTHEEVVDAVIARVAS